MAFDPVTGMILGQIGSAAVGGKMAPEPQEATSFGGMAPEAMRTANNELKQFADFYKDYMAQPVSMPSSFVQQPGGYWGNSLPMSFGLSGSDPALSNPSLLTRESPFANFSPGGGGMTPPEERPATDPGRMEPRRQRGANLGGQAGRDSDLRQAELALYMMGMGEPPNRKPRSREFSDFSDYR